MGKPGENADRLGHLWKSGDTHEKPKQQINVAAENDKTTMNFRKTWDYQPMCRITLLALVDLTRCLRDHRAGMYVKLLTRSLQVWLKRIGTACARGMKQLTTEFTHGILQKWLTPFCETQVFAYIIFLKVYSRGFWRCSHGCWGEISVFDLKHSYCESISHICPLN